MKIDDNVKLYNLFQEIIGKFNNQDILYLANSLIEYVENDEV